MTPTRPKLLALVVELSAINSDSGPGGVVPINREATAAGSLLAAREALLLRHHAEGYQVRCLRWLGARVLSLPGTPDARLGRGW